MTDWRPIRPSRRTRRRAMNTVSRGHETGARSLRIIWPVLACLLLAAPAEGDEPPRNEAKASPGSAIDPGTRREPSDSGSLGPRSFRLGFTPDDLLDRPEINETVRETLAKHADLAAFHIGN